MSVIYQNTDSNDYHLGLHVIIILLLLCYNITINEVILKPNIHPDYQKVVFHDTAAETYFVVGSTIKTERTIDYEGKTYPYVTIDVSSVSHPFYTGEQRVTKKDGRVSKFNNRFGSIRSK